MNKALILSASVLSVCGVSHLVCMGDAGHCG
jgi:hypothetical protein